MYLFCPDVQCWLPVQLEQIQVPHVHLHMLVSALCHGCSPSVAQKNKNHLTG